MAVSESVNQTLEDRFNNIPTDDGDSALVAQAIASVSSRILLNHLA